MLKTLRSNTKWIMIIVAVSFVAMIIFAWGMDITGSRSGVGAGNIGKINGEDIPYTIYDNMVKGQRQRYGDGSRLPISQERRVHEEAWNAIVTQKVVEQEIAKRKITFTDQELVTFMKNSPPQLVNSPELATLFQEDGQFSMAKYQAFLNPSNLQNPQMAQLLQYIEMEAASRLPATKFQNSIMDAVTVNDTQVRDSWLNENEKRSAEWVFLDGTSVPRDSLNVDPSKFEAYYNAHQDDYKKGDRRTVSYVFVPLAPTAKDTTDVLEQAQLVIDKSNTGSDFSELANEYTDDPGNMLQDGTRRGGDLGYFGRGRMIPQFEEAAFSMQPGDISAPIVTQFGVHVIHVDSLKYKADAPKEVEEVKARHVLFRLEPSRETREAIDARVTAFRTKIEEGATITMQAQLENLTVMNSPAFESDAMTVPGIMGSTSVFVNRAFDAKTGELLPNFGSENGFFVVVLNEIRKAGVATIEEVRNEVERDLTAEMQAAYAKTVIDRIASRVSSGTKIDAAVEADEFKGLQYMTGEVYNTYYMRGLGTMNPFVAKIFQLEKAGDSTGVFANESGAGLAVLTEILPIDESKFEQDRDALKARLETQAKNSAISDYLQSLVDAADIVDNRHIFLGN